MDTGKLIALEKELGLKGQALRDWVDIERVREREARAEERNVAKEAAQVWEESEHRLLELKMKLEETQVRLQEAQNAAVPLIAQGAGKVSPALVDVIQRDEGRP